jgi:hypothetical protein
MPMRIAVRIARFAVVLLLAVPSFAALGGKLDSVERDQLRLRGAMHFRQTASYVIYEIQCPAGTIVREYLSTSGRIFAVEWQGPFIPELQPLLGKYFAQYSRSSAEQRARYVGKRPLRINEPGLVIDTSGHMGAYWGRAIDPGLLPAGVGIDDIR